jgi:tRNA nucleotidyltransferase (CCA-adding enzyme)
MNEYWKAFVTSGNPLFYVDHIHELELLPQELLDLVGVPQDELHHPEGDAFTHTMMVVKQAMKIANRENLNYDARLVLMFAALCHDLGKATHTQIHEDGRITSYGHAEAGVEPTITMLLSIGLDEAYLQYITPLVKEHMAHIGYYMPEVTKRQVRRLMQRLQPANIQMLGYLVEADMSGRGGKYFNQGLPDKFKMILEIAETIDLDTENKIAPIITGDDLQALGFIAGPQLGQIKQLVYEAQLEEAFTDQRGGYEWIMRNIIEGV